MKPPMVGAEPRRFMTDASSTRLSLARSDLHQRSCRALPSPRVGGGNPDQEEHQEQVGSVGWRVRSSSVRFQARQTLTITE